jgi:outer membrane protein assembly factor BamB
MRRDHFPNGSFIRIGLAIMGIAFALACGGGGGDPATPDSTPTPTPTPSPKTSGSDWLHYGYDAQYTSFNPRETAINRSNVSRLQRKWGVGCDDPLFAVMWASPAVYKGVLYSTIAGGGLTAYNAATGERLWQFGSGSGWAPPPVVSEDGIVLYMEGSYPTSLYAVRADNGQQLWKAPLGFDLGYSGTAMATVDQERNTVYVVENDTFGKQRLFALDKASGEVLWFKGETTDDVHFDADHVFVKDGKIYVDATVKLPDTGWWYDDRILRIDAASQAIEHVFDKPTTITVRKISKVALCGDKLAVTYCDRDDVFEGEGILVVYSLASQAVLWQKTFPSGIKGTMAYNPNRNTLYVPTDPYLAALDADTGKERWRYTGFGPIYNPSIANDIVYLMSDTNMYALNEDTGQKLFSFALGAEAEPTTQVAVGAGMLFFSGNGGTCDLFGLGL